MSRVRASSPRRPHFDYTAVGHVTIDVLADGSRRPGGGAFYSGLQAARLGQRTLVITRGVPEQIEALLAPFSSELTLRVLPAPHTTTLESIAGDPAHAQRMLAWAGAIEAPRDLDTRILHLAPVARETPSRWHGRTDFVGLSAQGLVRTWAQEGAPLERRALPRDEIPMACDAAVVSEGERESAAPLEQGAATLLAITRAHGPTLVTQLDGPSFEVPVPELSAVRDDIGAGDVFAAALFTALARGEHARAAVAFAHAAAAVRIEGNGPAAIGGAGQISARVRALS